MAEISCIEIQGLNQPTDQPSNKEKKYRVKTDSSHAGYARRAAKLPIIYKKGQNKKQRRLCNTKKSQIPGDVKD